MAVGARKSEPVFARMVFAAPTSREQGRRGEVEEEDDRLTFSAAKQNIGHRSCPPSPAERGVALVRTVVGEEVQHEEARRGWKCHARTLPAPRNEARRPWSEAAAGRLLAHPWTIC